MKFSHAPLSGLAETIKTTKPSVPKRLAYALVTTATIALLTSCGNGHVFRQTVEALGGLEALEQLRNVQITATGTRRISYESPIPASEMDPATFEATNGGLEDVSNYTATSTFDFQDDNLRLDTNRTQLFEIFEIIFAGNNPEFSIIFNGQQGYLNAPAAFSAPGPLPSHIAAAIRTQQKMLNPIIYVLEALDNHHLVEAGGFAIVEGKLHRKIFFDDDVAPVVLFINYQTGFITKIKTKENNMLVRDVKVEIFYRDWQMQGPVAFPNEVDIYIDGGLVTEEIRSAIVVEPDLQIDTFEIPIDLPPVNDETFEWGEQTHQNLSAFFNMGFNFQENRPEVDTTILAPKLTMYGRFPIVNINHFVVEHDGGVIVMEAGGTGESGDTLVARVAEDFPGRNITHLIQSHFHLDHAAGARSIVAAGAEIVVGNGVKDFWEDTLSAKSKVRPDTLSMSNVTPEITEVGLNESLVLIDQPDLKVTVYHTSLFSHAADSLLATVETNGEIFLFEGDFYNAGFVFPGVPATTVVLGGQPQLFAAMRDIGVIDDDCNSAAPLTFIPTHGFAQPLDEAIVQIENTPGLAGATGCI